MTEDLDLGHDRAVVEHHFFQPLKDVAPSTRADFNTGDLACLAKRICHRDPLT